MRKAKEEERMRQAKEEGRIKVVTGKTEMSKMCGMSYMIGRG